MAVGWTTDHNAAPDKHVITIDILSDVVDLDFKTASVMFGDEVLLQPDGCTIGSPLAAPLASVAPRHLLIDRLGAREMPRRQGATAGGGANG